MSLSKSSQSRTSYSINAVLIFASLILLVAIKLTSISFPGYRLWGIDQLSYFSKTFASISILLLMLFFYVFSSYAVAGFISGTARSIAQKLRGLPDAVKIAAWALPGALLLWFLRDSTNLLGDGLLRLGELKTAGLERIGNTAAAEPLDYFLHYVSFKYLFEPSGLSAETCFYFWSIAAGLIFVWIAWKLADNLKSEKISRVYVLMFIISWGGIMLFFGYIEDYSIAAALTLMFFYLAGHYLSTGKGIMTANLVFIAAFFMHNITLFLLPGVIYINLIEVRAKGMKSLLGPGLIILLIAGWLSFTYAKKQSGAFLLPESGTEPGYLLFSGNHLLDMLNGLLLLSPSFIALIWIQSIKRLYDDYRARFRFFTLLTAAAGIFAAFIIDPHLGMARDWDLIALPLLAFHLAIFINADWRKIGRTAQYAIIIFQIFSTVSWVLINTDEGRSISRYTNIVALDKMRSRLGYNRLGDYFLDRRRWQEAEDALQMSIAIGPHYRAYVGLGVALKSLGKYDRAAKAFSEALELSPSEPLALFELGSYHYAMGNLGKARELFLKLRQTPLGSKDTRIIPMLQDIDRRLSEGENAVR